MKRKLKKEEKRRSQSAEIDFPLEKVLYNLEDNLFKPLTIFLRNLASCVTDESSQRFIRSSPSGKWFYWIIVIGSRILESACNAQFQNQWQCDNFSRRSLPGHPRNKPSLGWRKVRVDDKLTFISLIKRRRLFYFLFYFTHLGHWDTFKCTVCKLIKMLVQTQNHKPAYKSLTHNPN